MKLYSTPASPFARKVRVLIEETGQSDTVEITNVALSPVRASDVVVAHNPVGKIPTLITDDGRALLDSRVICEYLDNLHAGPRLFPADGAARWRALTLQAMGDAIMDAGVLIRYEQVSRPKALFWPDWQEAQAEKALRTVAALDDRIEDIGDGMDIGIVSVGCALSYLDFRFPDIIDWRDGHPGLTAWYERLCGRPAMQATRLHDPAQG